MHGSRPRPIKSAFASVGAAVALVGSVTTSLVGWGVLTMVQGDALESLYGLIPGVVTAVTVALTAFGVIGQAEPQVTPVDDPVDNYGSPLRAELEW